MPWKLIKFIIIFAVFLFFIIFNYDNKSDINFGFFKIRDIPVFITVFTSFLTGLLCIFPFVLWRNKKKKGGSETGSDSGSVFGKKASGKNRYYDSDTDKSDSTGSGNYGID